MPSLLRVGDVPAPLVPVTFLDLPEVLEVVSEGSDFLLELKPSYGFGVEIAYSYWPLLEDNLSPPWSHGVAMPLAGGEGSVVRISHGLAEPWGAWIFVLRAEPVSPGGNVYRSDYWTYRADIYPPEEDEEEEG